jgi:hypothetical protein
MQHIQGFTNLSFANVPHDTGADRFILQTLLAIADELSE